MSNNAESGVGVTDVHINDIELRLQTTNPRLRLWAENFARIEPELLAWMDGLSSDDVLWDIGASIGHFALYAAIKTGATVVALEPEAQNFATMEYNHHLNGPRLRNPFIALNLAASDTLGIGRIHCGRYGAGEHVKVLDQPLNRESLEDFAAVHIQTVVKWPADRLVGELGLPRPTHLKIDVDGSEAATLRGAAALLAGGTVQSIFIELHDDIPGDRAAAALLAEAGYLVTEKKPVARMRGGVYDGLYNYVYRR